VDRWRGRYPGHPGSTLAIADIMGSAPTASFAGAAGTQVALLLPLTGGGAVGDAASQVRDGITAAFGLLPEAQRPQLRVYDTGAMSVEAALATAQAEGAGFIVGPLTRPEITVAADHAPRGVPMLLLNFLPFERASGPQIYQFALSPEDEARQVARRALAFDQKRAIVFAPTGDWGNRVVAAFRDELTRGGGSVIEQAAYDPSRSEYTSPIISALQIDESRARHKRVEEITGTRLVFQDRRRGDVQMIFAAGEPVALRQIRPQLRFFYAGGVPTYMTSAGYDPDPTANRDVDGMIFPDTPWMLQASGPIAEQREQTRSAWADRGDGGSRLFAFGFDAGQLVLGLRNPQNRWPIQGVTGRLAPDADRRITRELDWAEIRGGQAQIVPARP
jgi:hypothetical protein